MSKENSRLIINCGSTHISASIFSLSGKTLSIVESHNVALDYDYQDDGAWLDALDNGLKEIVKTAKLSGKANFIIPGNQVLAKTLLLPSVSEDNQAQALAFEAQYNLPYGLEEVVWDGETVSNDGIETEVLLGACKLDMANELCDIIRDSGLIIESINASTVLSFPAFELTNPNISEDVLLVNVGARSTTLFFKSKQGVFFRTINIGGNTLTQFISDTLGKGFSESNEIKHRFFEQSEILDEESSAQKLMDTCTSNFASRFAQEVKRSIVMYRRYKGADQIKRIFITGNGAKSKIISDKISSELGHDLEFFNSLDGIEIPSNLESNSLSYQLCEVIGEAAIQYKLIENIGSLNLVPENVKQELKFIRQKPILGIAAMLITLVPWLVFAGISKADDLKANTLREIKAISSPYELNEDVINRNKENARILSESISQVQGLVETKTNWIEFFADLQASIYNAKDVWIDDLTVVHQNEDDQLYEDDYDDFSYDDWEEESTSSNYEIVLKGKMLVRQSANEINQDILADRIKQIKTSFEKSSFVVSSSQPKISWKYLTDGLRVLPFEIKLTINPERPL